MSEQTAKPNVMRLRGGPDNAEIQDISEFAMYGVSHDTYLVRFVSIL